MKYHNQAEPDHVPIWYALGEATLATNDLATAPKWFQRVADSSGEHAHFPVRYVHSFRHLAEIARAHDQPQAARAAWQRFCAFWADGDLDREVISRECSRGDGSTR